MPKYLFNIYTTVEVEAADEEEAYDIVNESKDSRGLLADGRTISRDTIDRDVMLVDVDNGNEE